VCHGELACRRPDPRYLTTFYFWMSFGGVLGGLFNAIVAPLLFTGVVEYPLTLVLACLLAPAFHRRDAEAQRTQKARGERGPGAEKRLQSPLLRTPIALLPSFFKPSASLRLCGKRSLLDIALPLGLGLITLALVLGAQAWGLGAEPAGIAIMFGLPALVCFSFSRRPLRFGLGVAAILAASQLYIGSVGSVLYAERSFFGIHRVSIGGQGRYRQLVHGSTLHGMQSTDPTRSREPLTYYYRSGPLGQLFAQLGRSQQPATVAVVGLGAGSTACYAQPGQAWTFYEIDPAVERIARDPRFFTFLRDCAPDAPVVLGDARLALKRAPQQGYELIILDAYSSDSIPLHLLTREALQLYVAKLAPDGVLAFHISNQHLDLEPVLGNLARDAGLSALVQNEVAISSAESEMGKAASQWAVLARAPADLESLAADPRWQPLRLDAGTGVWTDDFASLLSVFTW
jgi:spermidine synthase